LIAAHYCGYVNATVIMSRLPKLIRIRASNELHARLTRIADKRETTASEIAREGILKHLTNEETRIAEEGGSFAMGPLLEQKEGQP
jgi:predicted transcriptional regulator